MSGANPSTLRAMRGTIRLFCDFVSPYAYLAWTQLPRIAARHGYAVQPTPVLFAALLDAHGTIGPAEVPARRRYLITDVARKAHAFAVPIAAPFAHPFNPLLALRIASLPMPDGERARVIDVLYRAAWVERRDVTQAAVVAVALRAAGLDPALVDRAADAKDLVRAQTTEAIALGVFGVPTMVVDDELFWGTDSLGDLEQFLQGSNPVSKDWVDRWASLPAAATRPRSPRPA
jgi:2-hydroxychromene-2-carboxylate isomerase